MKNYKTRVRMYAAWNYQREIDDLNEMSERGWQLVKGGLFSSRFKKDDSIKYRYQLDYQPKIDDRPRYVESHREFGWEYINSTFNGWHYFRKAYDPTLPEEEYEIFSDRSSLKEMNGRWVKLAIVLTVFSSLVLALQIVHLILNPMLPTLFMMIAYAVMTAVFIRGIAVMKNPDRSKRKAFDRVLIVAFLIIVFGSLIGSFILQGMRPGNSSSMNAAHMEPIPAQTEEALLWNTVEVKYNDNYYIDTEIKADAPVTVSLLDEDGEAVYTLSGTDVAEDDRKVRLEKGEYKLYLSDFDGGALDVYFDMD